MRPVANKVHNKSSFLAPPHAPDPLCAIKKNKLTRNDRENRQTKKEDLQGLKEVLNSSELFPSEYLDDMISDYFDNPESEEIWFTSTENGNIIGLGYCTPEKLTEGTYNLLAIAVRKELQGQGEGRKMIAYIENLLSKKANRILIVETSSDPQFELAREFYDKLGYRKEATIRDFGKMERIK